MDASSLRSWSTDTTLAHCDAAGRGRPPHRACPGHPRVRPAFGVQAGTVDARNECGHDDVKELCAARQLARRSPVKRRAEGPNGVTARRTATCASAAREARSQASVARGRARNKNASARRRGKQKKTSARRLRGNERIRSGRDGAGGEEGDRASAPSQASGGDCPQWPPECRRLGAGGKENPGVSSAPTPGNTMRRARSVSG